MKERNNLDIQIRHALHSEGDRLNVTTDMKEKIDEQILQQECTLKVVDITDLSARRKKERVMKKINKVWIAVAAIAVCILIPTGVYAAGQITSYVSSISLGHSYDSYEELGKAQEQLGLTFNCVENFSNGYQFSKMDISGVDKLDENNNNMGSFKEWWGYYVKDGAPKITMIVHEVQAEAAQEIDDAMEKKEISGVTVSYKSDHYKFVPVDYELTPEDEANMAGEHYYISYGSDEVEESDICFVYWEKDGVDYSLMCSDATISADDFFKMAEEVIAK